MCYPYKLQFVLEFSMHKDRSSHLLSSATIAKQGKFVIQFGDLAAGFFSKLKIMEKEKNASQIIDQFLDYFEPAQTIADATDFLSTNEVCEAMNQFVAQNIVQPEQVYELMTANQFNYAPDPNKIQFQLKWLLIRNS